DAAARPLLPAPLIFSSDPAATQLDTLSLHDALPISVLFYAALWSQGNHAAVLAGAAVAAVVLAIIAGVMLRVSMRLPFGTFFKASAALIAVLAVVLAGKGVAALQEAGWVSMTLVPVPRVDLLGIHPTLETLLAQVVVLVVLVAGFAWNARTARAAAVAG